MDIKSKKKKKKEIILMNFNHNFKKLYHKTVYFELVSLHTFAMKKKTFNKYVASENCFFSSPKINNQ